MADLASPPAHELFHALAGRFPFRRFVKPGELRRNSLEGPGVDPLATVFAEGNRHRALARAENERVVKLFRQRAIGHLHRNAEFIRQRLQHRRVIFLQPFAGFRPWRHQPPPRGFCRDRQ